MIITDLSKQELIDIQLFSTEETERYLQMRNVFFTHKGAMRDVLFRRSPLYKFYDQMTGCINIPKSLFKDDIVTEAIKLITNTSHDNDGKGLALEYVDIVVHLGEIDGVYYEECFYSIREVEPWY